MPGLLNSETLPRMVTPPFPGKPVPCLTTLSQKKFFLIFNLNLEFTSQMCQKFNDQGSKEERKAQPPWLGCVSSFIWLNTGEIIPIWPEIASWILQGKDNPIFPPFCWHLMYVGSSLYPSKKNPVDSHPASCTLFLSLLSHGKTTWTVLVYFPWEICPANPFQDGINHFWCYFLLPCMLDGNQSLLKG